MNDDEPSVMGAGAAMPPMPTEADRLEAYKRLYVARMVARGLNQEEAAACFDAGDVDYDTSPEDAADDELSYWDNDE
jgi:hypothetical protein